MSEKMRERILAEIRNIQFMSMFPYLYRELKAQKVKEKITLSSKRIWAEAYIYEDGSLKFCRGDQGLYERWLDGGKQ